MTFQPLSKYFFNPYILIYEYSTTKKNICPIKQKVRHVIIKPFGVSSCTYTQKGIMMQIT